MNKNNDSVLIMEKALNIKDEVYVEKILIFISLNKNKNQNLINL